MRIVAVGVGTRGDIQPLAELGQEMIARGHEYSVITYERFRPLVEGMGVGYLHLDGDADQLMDLLVTNYRTDLDFMRGCRTLFKASPAALDQVSAAVASADYVLYTELAGFARSACELHGKRCARVFYCPFDRTDQYSLHTDEWGTPATGKSYNSQDLGMNLLTVLLANKWRRSHGLSRWTLHSDYRTMNGRSVLTFFPNSALIMPPDPAWEGRAYVTGYWYHPERDEGFEPPEDLARFLAKGERPIFVGFGKAESEELAELQRRTLRALIATGIRAVVQADQIRPSDRAAAPEHLTFVDQVPYSWMFEQVRGVVHHGGCTTVGLAMRAGVPQLGIPLALDQRFNCRRAAMQGLGPDPLYIRKKLCSEAELETALTNLVSGRYDKAAAEAAAFVRAEGGCAQAADLIEADAARE